GPTRVRVPGGARDAGGGAALRAEACRMHRRHRFRSVSPGRPPPRSPPEWVRRLLPDRVRPRVPATGIRPGRGLRRRGIRRSGGRRGGARNQALLRDYGVQDVLGLGPGDVPDRVRVRESTLAAPWRGGARAARTGRARPDTRQAALAHVTGASRWDRPGG